MHNCIKAIDVISLGKFFKNVKNAFYAIKKLKKKTFANVNKNTLPPFYLF